MKTCPNCGDTFDPRPHANPCLCGLNVKCRPAIRCDQCIAWLQKLHREGAPVRMARRMYERHGYNALTDAERALLGLVKT